MLDLLGIAEGPPGKLQKTIKSHTVAKTTRPRGFYQTETMPMKKYLAALLLCGFMQTANAIDTYDPDTGILNLDSVVVGGIKYNKVKVLLLSYDVLGVGSEEPYNPTPPPIDPISDTCSSNNLTTIHYNLIQLQMTLDQVNRILGCRNDPDSTYRSAQALTYVWRYNNRVLYVLFDTAGIFTHEIGGGIFKQAIGF